jgi:hypothetical protein
MSRKTLEVTFGSYPGTTGAGVSGVLHPGDIGTRINFLFTNGTDPISVENHTVTIIVLDPDNIAKEWATSAPGGEGANGLRCVVTNGTTVNICKAGTYRMQGYAYIALGATWKTEIIDVVVEANLG